MKEYVIATDITSDLPNDLVTELGLLIVPFPIDVGGKQYRCDSSFVSDIKGFYDKLRNGDLVTTSQPSPEDFVEIMTPALEAGKDVLYICFSSGLSGAYNSARLAEELLSERFPEREFAIVDSKAASMGEGLMVYYAAHNRKNGMSLQENKAWILENKDRLCHVFTVDDLFFLQRGGRVSKVAAVFGSMLAIKPLLHVSLDGKLIPYGKARGRKASLAALADKMGEIMENDANKIFTISHGDCLEDAEYLRDIIRSRFGIQDCIINYCGGIVGAHAGPGVVALFFLGDKGWDE